MSDAIVQEIENAKQRVEVSPYAGYDVAHVGHALGYLNQRIVDLFKVGDFAAAEDYVEERKALLASPEGHRAVTQMSQLTGYMGQKKLAELSTEAYTFQANFQPEHLEQRLKDIGMSLNQLADDASEAHWVKQGVPWGMASRVAELHKGMTQERAQEADVDEARRYEHFFRTTRDHAQSLALVREEQRYVNGFIQAAFRGGEATQDPWVRTSLQQSAQLAKEAGVSQGTALGLFDSFYNSPQADKASAEGASFNDPNARMGHTLTAFNTIVAGAERGGKPVLGYFTALEALQASGAWSTLTERVPRAQELAHYVAGVAEVASAPWVQRYAANKQQLLHRAMLHTAGAPVDPLTETEEAEAVQMYQNAIGERVVELGGTAALGDPASVMRGVKAIAESGVSMPEGEGGDVVRSLLDEGKRLDTAITVSSDYLLANSTAAQDETMDPRERQLRMLDEEENLLPRALNLWALAGDDAPAGVAAATAQRLTSAQPSKIRLELGSAPGGKAAEAIRTIANFVPEGPDAWPAVGYHAIDREAAELTKLGGKSKNEVLATTLKEYNDATFRIANNLYLYLEGQSMKGLSTEDFLRGLAYQEVKLASGDKINLQDLRERSPMFAELVEAIADGRPYLAAWEWEGERQVFRYPGSVEGLNPILRQFGELPAPRPSEIRYSLSGVADGSPRGTLGASRNVVSSVSAPLAIGVDEAGGQATPLPGALAPAAGAVGAIGLNLLRADGSLRAASELPASIAGRPVSKGLATFFSQSARVEETQAALAKAEAALEGLSEGAEGYKAARTAVAQARSAATRADKALRATLERPIRAQWGSAMSQMSQAKQRMEAAAKGSQAYKEAEAAYKAAQVSKRGADVALKNIAAGRGSSTLTASESAQLAAFAYNVPTPEITSRLVLRNAASKGIATPFESGIASRLLPTGGHVVDVAMPLTGAAKFVHSIGPQVALTTALELAADTSRANVFNPQKWDKADRSFFVSGVMDSRFLLTRAFDYTLGSRVATGLIEAGASAVLPWGKGWSETWHDIKDPHGFRSVLAHMLIPTGVLSADDTLRVRYTPEKYRAVSGAAYTNLDELRKAQQVVRESMLESLGEDTTTQWLTLGRSQYALGAYSGKLAKARVEHSEAFDAHAASLGPQSRTGLSSSQAAAGVSAGLVPPWRAENLRAGETRELELYKLRQKDRELDLQEKKLRVDQQLGDRRLGIQGVNTLLRATTSRDGAPPILSPEEARGAITPLLPQ